MPLWGGLVFLELLLGPRRPQRVSSLLAELVSGKGSRDVADHMTIQMDDSDSITVSEQSEPSAECWQNMYKLLNFYSLISDPTGILEKSSPEACLSGGPRLTLTLTLTITLEKSSPEACLSEGGRRPSEPFCRVIFENEQEDPATPGRRRRSLVSSEPQHVTLIVFGIGMGTGMGWTGPDQQSLSGVAHGSLWVVFADILHQKMTETCASAHIGGVNIVLLEGITPDIQTVVKCNIAKSQALYSAQRGLRTNNAAVFRLGSILINIPQHPATLHSMMVRSSHQLSKQISDLIRQPAAAPPPHREDTPTPQPPDRASSFNQTPVEANEFPQLPEGLEKKPIVLKFSAMMDGITIGAALLPSLKAEYKMGRMKSHGMTGAQTSFTFELPNHKLCFQSKVSPVDMSTMSPSASLTLPPVTMSGEYIMEDHDSHSDQGWAPDDFPAKPGNYLQGNYLRCVAEIGSFEHNLTTDLLNHLVFLQRVFMKEVNERVFMKEVNEVIQKVSGGEQPIPLWNEHDSSTDADKPKILLYSLSLMFKMQIKLTREEQTERKRWGRWIYVLRCWSVCPAVFQGIQMTATTPSMRAVRFETGLIELELSNRIQCKAQPGGSSSYLKLFGKCQVDLNLALGQIVKHQVSGLRPGAQAGSDFHQVAYFRTRIGLRNALQEEISGSSDKEAVLITLNRPIVFAQPVAFDRGCWPALFGERWPSPNPNPGRGGAPAERNIDFELDVRVEIDSGKCVLHPTTPQAEHEDVSFRRSCERSVRSLDQESPPKKKKLQPAYSSTTHLLAGKKGPAALQSKPNDLETTVFYIPGVDVKLHYNSKTLKTESPNASRGSSLSKESKLFGMKDSGPPNPPQSRTNSLLPPPPPPLPPGTEPSLFSVFSLSLHPNPYRAGLTLTLTRRELPAPPADLMIGDMDDFPDIRVDASSPGPRVTFNIQDSSLNGPLKASVF
ncbi:unnamed protein product [Menidia menidia]|uniref:(Atlantic silverside) hypothetical protein n=1 Tax=Menidia menidia TaxID=238744 RepID=A0A8S4BX36_9TELE|nr:unnamed protein product [Menidia menidia]